MPTTYPDPNPTARTTARPTDRPTVDRKTEEERPAKVMIHNDDVTPMDFVMMILFTLFNLSEELAEHIMWEAHTKGLALVVTLARPEAQRLVTKAHTIARKAGFPLTFTVESE